MTSQNNVRHKRESTNRNMLGPRIDIHAQNPFYETMEILYTLLFYGLSEIYSRQFCNCYVMILKTVLLVGNR